ncbi:MAG: hypothetical protein R3C61_13170 [Bacteroidia bacterium]
MGSSIFHLYYSGTCFISKTILPKKKFWVPTNEAGLHLDYKGNLASDIVIVEKEKIENPLSEKYNNTPPKFVIEVDIAVEPKDYSTDPPSGSEMDYIVEKSGQLLDFGVTGIAWILTKSRKVILVKSHRNMEIYNWNELVPIFDDYSFCLQKILEEEDILPAKP